MRGAEAVVGITRLIGNKAVRKSRVRKSYRAGPLDLRLRSERTRMEARLLHRAKIAGVDCPTVLEVGDFDLVLSFIEGRRPDMEAGEARLAGGILASLHKDDIIHGDFTPANLIINGEGMHVIDFGLGFVSFDIEDKAVDVFTMLRSLRSPEAKSAFIEGYCRYQKAGEVLERVKDVEKRVRYAF